MIAVKNITIASLLDPPNHIQNEPGYQIENPPQSFHYKGETNKQVTVTFAPKAIRPEETKRTYLPLSFLLNHEEQSTPTSNPIVLPIQNLKTMITKTNKTKKDSINNFHRAGSKQSNIGSAFTSYRSLKFHRKILPKPDFNPKPISRFNLCFKPQPKTHYLMNKSSCHIRAAYWTLLSLTQDSNKELN